jgi:hypothetical protein
MLNSYRAALQLRSDAGNEIGASIPWDGCVAVVATAGAAAVGGGKGYLGHGNLSSRVEPKALAMD